MLPEQLRNSPTAGSRNVESSTARWYVNRLEGAGLLAEITGQALTLAHLRRPTPTPPLPPLGFEGDVAQLAPGGPAPAEVPGAGLGLIVLSKPKE